MQRVARKKIETKLCGKAPTKEKHREFAKQNLRNTGRKNLNGTALSEDYPGTAHLGFQSAETLCLQITKIGTGEMYFSHYFTLTVIVLCRKISKSSPEDFLV